MPATFVDATTFCLGRRDAAGHGYLLNPRAVGRTAYCGLAVRHC